MLDEQKILSKLDRIHELLGAHEDRMLKIEKALNKIKQPRGRPSKLYEPCVHNKSINESCKKYGRKKVSK